MNPSRRTAAFAEDDVVRLFELTNIAISAWQLLAGRFTKHPPTSGRALSRPVCSRSSRSLGMAANIINIGIRVHRLLVASGTAAMMSHALALYALLHLAKFVIAGIVARLPLTRLGFLRGTFVRTMSALSCPGFIAAHAAAASHAAAARTNIV